MLISRGPLRVSLFGGGSDLPSFTESNQGCVLSFAIHQSVYVIGHPFKHRDGLLLKYSSTEDVQNPDELRHPIAREVLMRYSIRNYDIAVMSDVPAGTGLGSSSAFTVAMLAFARAVRGLDSTPYDLANEAAEIEIDVLKEPIGRQDQWASAFGGFNKLVFDGSRVSVERISISAAVQNQIEANCFLLPVGHPRRTAEVLGRQLADSESGIERERMTGQLAALVERGIEAINGNIDDLGPLLDQAWTIKKQLFDHVSTSKINDLYRLGINSGATGGKLLGAGVGGYLLFYVPQVSHRTFREVFPNLQTISICQSGGGIIYES